MEKQDYIDAYLRLERDEDVETVEEIVGYYLINYPDSYYSMWLSNLAIATEKWVTDQAVTKILASIK